MQSLCLHGTGLTVAACNADLSSHEACLFLDFPWCWQWRLRCVTIKSHMVTESQLTWNGRDSLDLIVLYGVLSNQSRFRFHVVYGAVTYRSYSSGISVEHGCT